MPLKVPLKVALIGLGAMGQNHLRVLSSLEGVNLIGVVEKDSSLWHGPTDFSVFREISDLEGLGIDFAVVATPTHSHEKICIRLANIGCHVLVEKPIAVSVEEGERMEEKFSALGRLGAVGYIERFNPAVTQLKMRLEAGEIGEIYQISTRRQGSFPTRVADIGVTKDLATHDIDIASWISSSRYTEICGQTSKKSGRDHEDIVVATCRLESGVIVNHVVNWLSPMKERVVSVIGERGMLIADTLTGDLTLHENGSNEISWESYAVFRGVTEGNTTRFAFPKKEPLQAELEDFRDAVAGGESRFVTFGEGVEALRVATAILTSAQSGRMVSLR